MKLWGGVIALMLLGGCGGGVYRPAEQAGFELDPAFEINDEDVAKAFSARPQLPRTFSVASYSFDPGKADEFAKLSANLAGVQRTYSIPELLVTGERRFEEPVPRHYGGPQPKPVSIKKLRLLAARAHCELLTIYDYGYRHAASTNAWVVSTVLMVPTLFAPFLDNEVESYLDVFVIDVKNGYLYAHVTRSEKGHSDYNTIWSGVDDELIEAQYQRLSAAARAELERLFKDASLRPVAKPAAPVEAPAPAAADGPPAG